MNGTKWGKESEEKGHRVGPERFHGGGATVKFVPRPCEWDDMAFTFKIEVIVSSCGTKPSKRKIPEKCLISFWSLFMLNSHVTM